MSQILREWRADWMLSERSQHTIDNYQRNAMGLIKREPDLDAWNLALVRGWIGEGRSDQIRRMRARSIKALLRWVTGTGHSKIRLSGLSRSASGASTIRVFDAQGRVRYGVSPRVGLTGARRTAVLALASFVERYSLVRPRTDRPLWAHANGANYS